jgi:hypothetical protein
MAGGVAATVAVSMAALGQGSQTPPASTWGGHRPAVDVVDAGAPAQGVVSTWKGPSPAPVVDASAPPPKLSTWGGQPAPVDAGPATPPPVILSTWGTGAVTAPPASEADAAATPPVATRAVTSPPASPPEQDAGGADDGGGGFDPSDVGLAVGLRGGYGVPFGLANGSPLSTVTLGMAPIQADVGWFVNRHLYIGGYFIYGFGIGADLNNDQCNGTDIDCTATMIRFGAVVHYHFAPAAMWDPWIGAGLGYELINLISTDNTDASNPLSGYLQGIDTTFEAGLDLKPIHYLGIGPYVELATGPYLGTSSFEMHGWVNFGLRFRTNL